MWLKNWILWSISPLVITGGVTVTKLDWKLHPLDTHTTQLHTHHHDNTSSTQPPQQLVKSHYTHACCRKNTLSPHYGAGIHTNPYLLTLDIICSFWAGPVAMSLVNLPCSCQTISHPSCNLDHPISVCRLVQSPHVDFSSKLNQLLWHHVVNQPKYLMFMFWLAKSPHWKALAS